MSPEALSYPFLFIALFFESFILVTFLSKPAREARARTVDGTKLPSVAVIVPCWNEAETIEGTTNSLLALEYPKEKLEIILVNDGSTDSTPEVMARFASNPQIKIIHKQNGGKHTALNAGIAATQAEIVGCLDADSFVDPKALLEIVQSFKDKNVAATTPAMSIHKPSNALQHMQHAEYTFGITLRHALSSVNGVYVTPGPFSFYRRDVVVALGGFRYGHQTEDMEMALRIQRAGYRIDNAPRARVYTKGPRTVTGLIKQRTRWVSGFLRNMLGEYRDFILSPKRGALGMLVLPSAIVAMYSSILLFFALIFFTAKRVVEAAEMRQGIPLSYMLASAPKHFEWFYAPVSMYLTLAVVVMGASITFMVLGKRVSRTPGKLAPGVISYALMYGLIVPLWLMRAASDVALGKKRGWRA